LVNDGIKLKNQGMFEQAGNRGYAKGWAHLIELYSKEEGVKRDENEVSRLVELVKSSTDGGDAVGQYLLGWMFCSGHGVAKDATKAFEWFLKSAEQGNEDAQCHLGWMLDYGNGVAKDETKAVEWYLKSAEQKGETIPRQLPTTSNFRYCIREIYPPSIEFDTNTQPTEFTFLPATFKVNDSAQTAEDPELLWYEVLPFFDVWVWWVCGEEW
jgi:TPR repeat protein